MPANVAAKVPNRNFAGCIERCGPAVAAARLRWRFLADEGRSATAGSAEGFGGAVAAAVAVNVSNCTASEPQANEREFLVGG